MKKEDPTGGVLFEEVQHFPRWVKFLMLTPVFVIGVVMLIPDFYSRNDKNEIITALVIVALVQLLLIFIFSFVRLEKVVTRDGLYYRWLPLQKRYRVISRNELESWQIRRSPFFRYGYSWFPGYGSIHNMGREGIQLFLADGRKVFFSSDDTVSFDRAIREFYSTAKNWTGG